MDSTSSNSQATPSKEEPQKFIKELDKYAQRILKEAIISLVTEDESLIPKFREALTKVATTKTRGRRNSQPPPLNPTDSPRRGRAYQRRNSVSSGSSFNFGKAELGKRIYLYTNGGRGSGIAMMVPKTWDLLLDEAGQKLRYGQAVTKIYDYDTGNQLNQVDELQAGMKIIGIPDNQKFHNPSESNGDFFRRISTGKSQTPRTPTKKSVKQAWAPKSPRTTEPKSESRRFPEASIPIRRVSPSPVKATAPPPAKSVSPAPAKSVSPAPAKPAPNKSVSPAPAKTVSPAPAKSVSPAPAKTVSPAPTKTVSPAPAKSVSPAPTKSAVATKRTSPAPAKSVSPTPSTKQVSPAPISARKEPEAKKEEPKQEETKKEEPKKEEPKKEEPKKEEPKKEEPKKEEPKVEPKPVEVQKPVEVKKEVPKVEPVISPRKEETPKVEVTKVETPATQGALTQALSPRQLKADQEVASVTQKPQETVKKSESTDSLSATSPVSATSPARVLSPQEKEAEIKRSIEDRIMERVRMMKQTKQ